jgi:tRNA A-37 threonylcarbamoyl transferase component Bud32
MEEIGKYKIIDVLGKGAMGIVYKGLDPDIDRKVAIKTVHFDKALHDRGESESLKRFIREAQAAGKLDHPNITTVYDVVKEKDVTYIVMQYVEGMSLQELLASQKKLSIDEINQLFVRVCSGLDYAHKKGIVHRDIKPANILIDKEMNPFIVDFGVARVETSTLTQTGTAMGTPSYMSPEQVQGKKIDNRSDIFSLGVVLYEMLAGKRPFEAESVTTIIYKIINEEPPDVTSIRKDVPAGYEHIIHKSLAKNPNDRYKSCHELATDLAQISQKAQETLSMSLVGEDTDVLIRRKRKKLSMLVLGAAAALVVIVLVGGFAGHRFGWWTIPFLSGNTEQASTSETTLPAETKIVPVQPETDPISQVKTFLANEEYSDAVQLAEELLAENPDNDEIKGYLEEAQTQIRIIRVDQLVRQGTDNYNRRQYSQSIRDMREVLKLDNENAEAKRYIDLASREIWRAEINRIVERQRKAEEEKDLLTLLNDMGSSGVSDERRSDAMSLFNFYDDIQSVISNVNVRFIDSSNADVSFSHLLTATNKRSGTKELIFEGVKSWKMKKEGQNWKITQYK